jgi:hypothetical protein
LEAYTFNAEEILLMHDYVMSETNDLENSGVKLHNQFEAMLERPNTETYGIAQYPSPIHKACV